MLGLSEEWPFTYYWALPIADGPGELERRQLLLSGSLRLGQLADERLRAADECRYADAANHLVACVRDQLLGIALQGSTRSLITSDSSWLQPNPHAVRFFQGPYVHRLWRVRGVIHDGFYGVAGSLAFALYQAGETGAGLAALPLLERMLQVFWQQQDCDYTHPPRLRLQALLERCGLVQNWAGVTRYLDALYRLVPADQPDPLRGYLYELHRCGLGPRQWDYLQRRMLFLHVHPALERLWPYFQQVLNNHPEWQQQYGLPARDPSWWSGVVHQVLQVAIPAGFALVLWCLVLEGLVKAAALLDPHAELPLAVYMERVDLEAHRYEVATVLALAHDALEALGWFEVVEAVQHRALQQAVLVVLTQLLQSLGGQEIPLGGPYRLDVLV